MIPKLLIAAVLSAAIGITACEERHSSAVITMPPNAAGTGAVPETIQFPAEDHAVLFSHVKHVERSQGDCSVCHDKLFPKTVQTALNYGGRDHRPAERNQRSCAACHVAGGKAFAAKDNCGRCHSGEAHRS